ncbi:uncharacterized protein LOC131928559 [Physella acuta]|uniref:uncharacterized protein LOC131928559 n=1 Tax=Physella acuta TaxID=109671 RepID=UPI0027DADD41|nr:uncharacterized protein LOC131928559 [Physella acuta]
MVFKVCKGGVRSGNTLRGLHSFQAKRYARQACIVSHSNLSSRRVQRIIETNTDNEQIAEALRSTEVILSLNKKQRWRIPATVSHMIRSGDFNEERTKISMLERHKLKRKANCLRYICNRGRLGFVAPKQKSYFNLNLENFDDEISNRMFRREKAEYYKTMKTANPLKEKNVDKSVEVIEVLTISGNKDIVKPPKKKQSELCLEVFYPCPKSCSLTFNPKYTDVSMEMNEEGKMEIRSNKKVGKKKGKRRQVLWYNYNEAFRDEIFDHENFVEDDDEDDVSYRILKNKKNKNLDESDIELDNSLDPSLEESGENKHSNIFADYVLKAESAVKEQRLDKQKLRKRSFKTPRNRRNVDENILSQTDDNVRIDEPKTIPFLEKTSNVSKIHDSSLPYAKVILLDAETSPVALQEEFGELYSEANCSPRRFLINITHDVVDKLSFFRVSKQMSFYTSYLVFIMDEVFDSEKRVFKVLLSSNFVSAAVEISDFVSFQQSTLKDVVDSVVKSLLEKKNANSALFYKMPPPDKIKEIPDLVSRQLKLEVEVFHCTEICNEPGFLQEKMSAKKSLLPAGVIHPKTAETCGICYSELGWSQETEVSSTRLHACAHVFCDPCWRSYIKLQLAKGSSRITCPTYLCSTEVGPVTLLSLLPFKDVLNILQRSFKSEIYGDSNLKLCPNPDCDRVIKVKVNPELNNLPCDVTCTCGVSSCFSCLAPAHWPAKCKQAQIYINKLKTTLETPKQDNSGRKLKQIPPPKPGAAFKVEVNACPRCHIYFTQLKTLCYLTCLCGHSFCGFCLTSQQNHTMGCQINQEYINSLTKVFTIRHIEGPKLPLTQTPEKSELEIVQENTSENSNLLRRAAEERGASRGFDYTQDIAELATLVTNKAVKDASFMEEVTKISGYSPALEQTHPHQVLHHVTQFLHYLYDVKQTLHHVAEFTFVLAKDAPGTPERQRVLTLANDISGYGSFIHSVLSLGDRQDPRVAVRRLSDILAWSRRAVSALSVAAEKLRQ